MYRNRWTLSIALVALAFSFSAGLATGLSERVYNLAKAQVQMVPSTTITNSTTGGAPKDIDFSQFWDAWQVLEENFVQTHASGTLPTAQERMWGAISGLAESYGDPYTVFLPPEDAQAFEEEIRGSFSGVGMELGQRDGVLTVVAPLKGTPAERAGVRSGDTVLSIDGVPSSDMAVEQAVKRIRGEKGTTVTLTLGRAGESKPIEVKIVRDTISVPIIESYKRTDGIFVIELYSFSQTSDLLFRQALREFFESGATKLILDLRGNPGGYLESAVEMSSFFLPVGDPIVTEDFGGSRENSVHRSYGYNVFANKKLTMAVLVNQGSASASEILAGALQQHGVATLVGERTFGKGSVQQLVSLGGGAELKITIARWLTPNGTSISDGGLTPDIPAVRTVDDIQKGKDPQMDAAITWFATQ